MLRLFAALLFVVSAFAHAAPVVQTDLPLRYLEAAHAEDAGKPLVILMHGYGGSEENFYGIQQLLPDGYTYLMLRAPLTVRQGAYQWFNQKRGDPAYDGVTDDLRTSTETLARFIAQATDKYRSSPRQVVLIGFSQGAMMSFETGLRHPELVRAIAPLSGRLLPVLKSQLKDDPRLKGLAVFIGHGKADTVVPYRVAPEARDTLQALGVPVRFHSYEGLGHAISREEVADLKQWLLGLGL